jgi:hypothetical protein
MDRIVVMGESFENVILMLPDTLVQLLVMPMCSARRDALCMM